MSKSEYIRFPVAKLNAEITRENFQVLLGRGGDDISPLDKGMRYSPKSIRDLIAMCSGTISDEDKNILYEVPNLQQFSANLLAFGFWMGFVSPIEKKLLTEGVPFIRNYPTEKKDVFLSKTPKGSSYIVGSVEKLSAYLGWDPILKSKVKVLFHGKWNVPHVGYYSYIKSTIEMIASEYNIPEDDLIPIIICERNRYISSVGSSPFMNTMWRASLMSYPPFSGVIVPGGDIDVSGAPDYWAKAYPMIKPDFIPIEKGDVFTNQKKYQANAVGAVVYERDAAVIGLGSKTRISSTGLVTEGGIDDGEFNVQYDAFGKQVGQKWRRKWF